MKKNILGKCSRKNQFIELYICVPWEKSFRTRVRNYKIRKMRPTLANIKIGNIENL